MKTRVGLKDIAAKTGFAVSVVSRALNPRPDRHACVAPETRDMIAKVAGELGFRRNRAAEFMKKGKLPTIGVFVPLVPNTLVANLIFGISEVAWEEDFPVQIASEMSCQDFRHFIQHNVDLGHSGIISYPFFHSGPETEREVENYRREGGKMVLLNTTMQTQDVPVVAIDDTLGGRLAAEHLLARGCARHGVVGNFVGRPEGFQNALAAHGKHAEAFDDGTDGIRRAAVFCREGALPVGLFAVTDKLALGVMRALSGTSLRVGRDVLIIGYDDLDLTADVTPALTTIQQPFREEGRVAARKLINMIYGGEESSITLPPRLVVRESA